MITGNPQPGANPSRRHLTVVPVPPQRRPGLVGAFRHAWAGLVHTAAYQRNMKMHLGSAELVACVGGAIALGLAEKVTLIFCVLLVFFAEVINTALEALVDLHTEDFRELARVTKDTAAAGVLVLAIGTVVLFAAIVVNDWPAIRAHPVEVARQLAFGGLFVLGGAVLTWRRATGKVLDVVALLWSLAFWASMARGSVSAVFSAVGLSMLVLQASAAWELRWKSKVAA